MEFRIELPDYIQVIIYFTPVRLMQIKLSIIIVFCCLESVLNGQELKSSDSLIVSEIKIEGNFVSSKKVIYRELAFKINKAVGRDQLDYLKQTSINNLTKTALFNFTEIELLEPDPGILKLTVKLTERWFIWPTLYLNHTDTNFSEWWRTKDLDKLEYGFGLEVNNFRGMGESVKLNFRLGNFTKYELQYLGIHLDKAEKHSLSLKLLFAEQKVLPWVIMENKYLTLKSDRKLLNNNILAAKYTYRKEYFNSHSISFGYTENIIADTVLKLNPYFLGLNNQRQRYFSLGYEFSRDTRDSHFYPKSGYLLVAGISKAGMGVIRNEYNRIDITVKLFGYRKIIDRLYGASGILFTSYSNVEPIFYDQAGLGSLQFVRGYEYYAINGDQTLLFKSLLKFELLPMQVINLKIWPIRKAYQLNRIPFEIYTNVFFDAGYVHDRFGIYKQNNNYLVNKPMYSTGVGIDFVTYYDKILRFDYSFNALGESGLFIHWKAAIR
jgi:outer membrane protein assembly factor BamA